MDLVFVTFLVVMLIGLIEAVVIEKNIETIKHLKQKLNEKDG